MRKYVSTEALIEFIYSIRNRPNDFVKDSYKSLKDTKTGISWYCGYTVFGASYISNDEHWSLYHSPPFYNLKNHFYRNFAIHYFNFYYNRKGKENSSEIMKLNASIVEKMRKENGR